MDRDIKFLVKASSNEVYAYEKFEICAIIESLYIDFLNIKIYFGDLDHIKFIDDSLRINNIEFKDINIRKGIHLNKLYKDVDKNKKIEIKFKAQVIAESNIQSKSLFFKLTYEYMKNDIRVIEEVLSNKYILKVKWNEFSNQVFCDKKKVNVNQVISYMCKVKYKGNVKSLIKVYIDIPKNTVLVDESLRINNIKSELKSWNEGFELGVTDGFYIEKDFTINFSVRVTVFADTWCNIVPKISFKQELEKLEIKKYESNIPILFYGYSAIKEFSVCGIFKNNSYEDEVSEIYDYYGSLVIVKEEKYLGPESIKDGIPYIVGGGNVVNGFIVVKLTYSTKNIQAPIFSEEFKLPFTEYIKNISDNITKQIVNGEVFDVFVSKVLENSIYVSVKAYLEVF